MTRRKGLLLLVHLIAAVSAIAATVVFTIHRDAGGQLIWDTAAFRYFTIDSNLFAALVSVLTLAYLPFLAPGAPLPRWLWVLRQAATASVAITFVTVMSFLAPIFGYHYMLDGPDLWLHLICPLLQIAAFVLLEGTAGVPLRHAWWGLLPAGIYGVVYGVMVVALKRWPDFYTFNAGGRWYLSLAALLVGATLVCFLLWRGNRRR